MTTTTIPTSAVRFVKELYPRLKPHDDVVERYRDAIENLPPIVVARDGVLVDGYHRWQAHVREGLEEIRAENLGDLSDNEIFNESIRRNAIHGQQLAAKDKELLAQKLWQTLAQLPNDEREAEISELLAVSARSIKRWTADARKAERKALREKAWDLWLDCREQSAIGDQIGVPQQTISGWVTENCQLADFGTAPESRQHFDIWQFPTTDRESGGQQSYFGAVPPQVMENLLWFYTDPGQIVVDLFAGSGTTVDVAKRMGRRVWAADIRGNHYSPHLPIHSHDATAGWPSEAPSKADLVFLDPPYWKQASGRYSSEPNELAEMPLDDFYAAWSAVVKNVLAHARRVAYIISPTELRDGSAIAGRSVDVIDHATDMLSPFVENGWRVERRIIVPYSTQQATGQQVTWARENKRMLKLYRDLAVLTA